MGVRMGVYVGVCIGVYVGECWRTWCETKTMWHASMSAAQVGRNARRRCHVCVGGAMTISEDLAHGTPVQDGCHAMHWIGTGHERTSWSPGLGR